MRKFKRLYTVLTASVVVIFASCQKDPEVGGTSMEKMAGDWHVRVTSGSATSAYSTLFTFNTSDNTPDAMWIQATGLRNPAVSPAGNIGVKGKVTVDLGAQTFQADNSSNVFATTAATIPTFKVLNGKIITKGTVGPASKTPTDSIMFDIEINGATYHVAGRHKTGFLEDLP